MTCLMAKIGDGKRKFEQNVQTSLSHHARQPMGRSKGSMGSTSQQLSTPTRLATEQTPEIPSREHSTPTHPATEQKPSHSWLDEPFCLSCDMEDDSDYDVPAHSWRCTRHKPTLRLGTTGLHDEHILSCKWCQLDIRNYIQVKAVTKWLYKQCTDLSIVGLIVQFLGHRLAFEQRSPLHRHSYWTHMTLHRGLRRDDISRPEYPEPSFRL